ncbi:MAG: hypothetical protein AAF798_17250 [Bacteroidota bacterium]
MSEFTQTVKEGALKVVSWIKRFFVAILLLAVLGGGIYLWACNWTYSDGTRAGVLIKISRKGVVWKTYEGQLNLGGFSEGSGDGLSGNIWEFSVWDDEIYEQLQSFEGQRVILQYRQKFKAMPWQGKTDYFIQSVKRVEDN